MDFAWDDNMSSAPGLKGGGVDASNPHLRHDERERERESLPLSLSRPPPIPSHSFPFRDNPRLARLPWDKEENGMEREGHLLLLLPNVPSPKKRRVVGSSSRRRKEDIWMFERGGARSMGEEEEAVRKTKWTPVASPALLCRPHTHTHTDGPGRDPGEGKKCGD